MKPISDDINDINDPNTGSQSRPLCKGCNGIQENNNTIRASVESGDSSMVS